MRALQTEKGKLPIARRVLCGGQHEYSMSLESLRAS